MKIELTPKEVFAAIKALKFSSRRIRFGVSGLRKKVLDQLKKEISKEEISNFLIEWKKVKKIEKPKKIKEDINKNSINDEDLENIESGF